MVEYPTRRKLSTQDSNGLKTDRHQLENPDGANPVVRRRTPAPRARILARSSEMTPDPTHRIWADLRRIGSDAIFDPSDPTPYSTRRIFNQIRRRKTNAFARDNHHHTSSTLCTVVSYYNTSNTHPSIGDIENGHLPVDRSDDDDGGGKNKRAGAACGQSTAFTARPRTKKGKLLDEN